MKQLKSKTIGSYLAENKMKELHLLKDHRGSNGHLDSEAAPQSEPEASVGLQRANSQ